ncbi:nitroreductase family protein [archaeon]|nr:nitroreductase family protein [archaeon]
MDALTNLFSRRSVRKYKRKPVEFEKLLNILDAGRLAPNAGNVQDWKFLVVTDKDKLEKLNEASLEQDWINEAPLAILICSESVKEERMYGPRGKNVYSIQNASCAAENMLLAAHAEGLGGCWVGSFDEKTILEVFSIPEDVIPRAILTFGYPDEKPEEKPKFSLYDVTFFNKWNNKVKDKAEFKKIFTELLTVIGEQAKKLTRFLPKKS